MFVNLMKFKSSWVLIYRCICYIFEKLAGQEQSKIFNKHSVFIENLKNAKFLSIYVIALASCLPSSASL